jgi:cytochrome b6-f complex iron-sulfur subunit
MFDPNRRQLLQGAVAAACATCAAACLPGSGGSTGGIIAAGNASDLAVGDLVAVPGESLAIGLDDNGLYSLSTLCTHALCDMAQYGSVSGNGLFCSCHGSQFDANGAVTRGPARTDLPHYAVSVDADGVIQIDSDTEVDANERVPVVSDVPA